MAKTITLQGTPPQIGEQLASQLLSQPLSFAFEQLDARDYELFCSALLAATAAMISRQIGTDRVARLTEVLAAVTSAVYAERKEALQ